MNSKSNTESTTETGVVPLRFKNVNLDLLKPGKLKDMGMQKSAPISYEDPTRSDERLFIQTGETIMVAGRGIPSLTTEEANPGKNFYPDDSKRDFIKLPLDPEQESCREMEKFFTDLDEKFSSDAFKEKMFGKKGKSAKYTPTIKIPQNFEEEEDEPKKKSSSDDKLKQFKYIKAKFDMSFDKDFSKRKMLTKFMEKKADGKIEPVTTIKTIGDASERIGYLSKVVAIIYVYKLWHNAKNEYGVGVKLHTFRYTTSARRTVVNMLLDDDETMDFDSDKKPSKQEKKTEESAKTKKKTVTEEEPVRKKKTTEPEEEPARKKKTVEEEPIKKKKTVEPEDEPIKKKKGKGEEEESSKKKKTKKQDSDNESDDETAKKKGR